MGIEIIVKYDNIRTCHDVRNYLGTFVIGISRPSND